MNWCFGTWCSENCCFRISSETFLVFLRMLSHHVKKNKKIVFSSFGSYPSGLRSKMLHPYVHGHLTPKLGYISWTLTPINFFNVYYCYIVILMLLFHVSPTILEWILGHPFYWDILLFYYNSSCWIRILVVMTLMKEVELAVVVTMLFSTYSSTWEWELSSGTSCTLLVVT